MKFMRPVILLLALSACEEKSAVPQLPRQADRWVNAVPMQSDSVATYVGKTSAILESSTAKPISTKSITIGDNVSGIDIGAIRCTFFHKDLSYSGDQFMLRGRWGCHAGRNRDEVDQAVEEDGAKLHDYIYVSPVTLK
jgi:hypothetical protein